MFRLELKRDRICHAIVQLRDQLYTTSLSDSPLSKYVSLKENTIVQIYIMFKTHGFLQRLLTLIL